MNFSSNIHMLSIRLSENRIPQLTALLILAITVHGIYHLIPYLSLFSSYLSFYLHKFVQIYFRNTISPIQIPCWNEMTYNTSKQTISQHSSHNVILSLFFFFFFLGQMLFVSFLLECYHIVNRKFWTPCKEILKKLFLFSCFP